MTGNIEDFYAKYGPMVLRRCRHLLNDESLALRAMEEVFAEILSGKYHSAKIIPSGLLYTLATVICLNMFEYREASDGAIAILHDQDGLTPGEIAEITGFSAFRIARNLRKSRREKSARGRDT